MHKIIFLGIIILIGLRFLWLDRIPVGMAHDELEYVLSGRTFWKVGTDISGTRFPLSLFKTNGLVALSPVPYILLSPIYGVLPLNIFWARLPMIMVNLLTTGGVYLITYYLFRKKEIAVASLIMFLASPWSIYFSRVVSDAPIALLFYVVGTVTFLRYSGKLLIIPLICFLLGFWSYQGAQPVLPLLVLILCIYKWGKEAKIFLAVMALILAGYFGISSRIGGSILSSRSTGLVFADPGMLAATVNEQRRLVIDNTLQKLMSNKMTVLGEVLAEKYITAFSPEVLFMKGDLRATYRWGEHGLLFWADILFLGTGILWIYQIHKKEFYLLVGILAVAPLATVISSVETSVINRSFLMLPIFMIIGGVGFWKLTRNITGSITVIFLMIVSIINFGYFYFFKMPVIAHENFFMSERIIANYVKRINKDDKTVILTEKPREMRMELDFFGISQKNVVVSDVCPEQAGENNIIVIAQLSRQKCLSTKPTLGIIEHHYGGAIYTLQNDKICQEYSTDKWRRNYLMSDYAMEKMNTQEFCNRWVMQI